MHLSGIATLAVLGSHLACAVDAAVLKFKWSTFNLFRNDIDHLDFTLSTYGLIQHTAEGAPRGEVAFNFDGHGSTYLGVQSFCVHPQLAQHGAAIANPGDDTACRLVIYRRTPNSGLKYPLPPSFTLDVWGGEYGATSVQVKRCSSGLFSAYNSRNGACEGLRVWLEGGSGRD